jgi:hypothetical protein
MTEKDRFKLLFGPYRTPRFKYGDVVTCEIRGDVKIVGLTAARIPWPKCRSGKRSRAIILYGALAEGVTPIGSAARTWQRPFTAPRRPTRADNDRRAQSGTAGRRSRICTERHDCLIARCVLAYNPQSTRRLRCEYIEEPKCPG